MATYHELTRRKEHLEEALHNIKLALESETYTTPFKHEVVNPLKPCEFNHPMIKKVLTECIDKKLGFDPDLFIQHAEKEVHNQFNSLIEENVKGRTIESLMSAKHEMELFLLKDRTEMYTKGLAKVNSELKRMDDSLSVPTNSSLPEALEIEINVPEASMEQKLEAVQTLVSEGVLTNKEIKKVLKIPAKKKKK